MSTLKESNQAADLEVKFSEVAGRLCIEFSVAGKVMLMSLNDLRRATGEIDSGVGYFSPEHQQNLDVYQEALKQYRAHVRELELA